MTAWEKISNSRLVLDLIKSLPFAVFPRFFITGFHLTRSGQAALLLEVKNLIQKKVLIHVPQGEDGSGFYSTIFLVKNEWYIQDHNQLKTSEQIHCLSEIQDGNVKVHHQPPFARMLYSIHQFKTHIVTSPHTPNFRNIFGLQ